MIAAQKLAPTWRAVVSVYEPFREGDSEFVWEAGVVGRERITAAGRTRDCWVVEQRDPSGQFATNTLWIDVRTRRIWQSRGRPAGGTFEWWHRVLNPCCRAPGWGHATAPARGRRGREERHARAHLQAHAVAQTVEPHQRHVPKVRS